MGRPGRRRCPRCISQLPNTTLFRPVGTPMGFLERVTLSFGELEALRLVDFDGMDQEEAAERMCVSRRTLNSDLRNARRKVADALTSGKLIEIRGENYIFLSEEKEPVTHEDAREKSEEEMK